MQWELVVLGTASQAPTRHRNHNGYLLHAGNEGLLFDPGEGTQRQLAFAGESASRITRIFLTHLHGDHCLGLPGIVQRLSLDQISRSIPLYYPASGEPYVERLLHASIADVVTGIVRRPIAEGGLLDRTEDLELSALPLRHRVDSFGYRVVESPRVNFDTDALDALGIEGPDVGRLRREGSLAVGGRTVRLDEVTVTTPGRVVAVVMDTSWCDAALELARDADLLVCESTFLTEHGDIAEEYGHLTARQAGELAALAGARQLLLTHFSQREPDTARYVREAAEVFPSVVGAEDLLRVAVPPRPLSTLPPRSGGASSRIA